MLNVITDKLKEIKLTLAQWKWAMIITWSILDAFIIYSKYPIFDILIINIGILIIYICTKVCAIGTGMLLASQMQEIQKYHHETIPDHLFDKPIKKKDMN